MGFLSLVGYVGLTALVLTGCAHVPGAAGSDSTSRSGRFAPLLACDKVLPLAVGAPLRASTRLGQDELRASCLRGAAPECVFALTVSEQSELRVALQTDDFDAALALYDAPLGRSPHELRCVDDLPPGDVHHARLEAAVAPGHYLVVVDGTQAEAGEFELFAELEPLASISDTCAHAAPLEQGAMLRDSTRGGTNLFSATCGGGGQGPEHVHSVRLERAARVRIRQQAEFDGLLYLRAQCGDASSELVCNDDFQTNARSMIAARLVAGTYYVFSDSYSREQSGEYTLTLERVDEPPAHPPELLCRELARQAGLSSDTLELDTLSGSFAFAGSCGGAETPEIALTLRVDAPTTLIARLEDAEFNAVLYLRRGCADPASEVACYVAPRIDRPPSEREMSSPALVVPLERGLYTLVLDGFEASDLGAATLRLAFTP